jgi:cytochrome d ubiquinol oxidase subunit I
MIDPDVVALSRSQFALTALYHFLFVPLHAGPVVDAGDHGSGLRDDRPRIWKRMTQFWGVLFGINFAMGVATGVTMEFQFGTNWAYYAHYVGDIFGTPLAIEGLMAFFLEATFIGLFFFGWDRLSRIKHLIVTFLLALGTNFSALWILIANAWMQNPVGSEFNFDTMRMEITDFAAVVFNPVAQSKFVHTVSAGYVLGSMFVLSISAWYLLRGRNVDFAKRSMTVAASFGLASALSVVVLGDESGYTVSENQKMKLAAIEAMWDTEPPPASFTAFGFPDVKERTTHLAIHIPWVMGLIGTRSIDTVMPGINQLVEEAESRIASGVKAYVAMQTLRKNRDDPAARAEFEQHKGDLGYALLLRRVMEDPTRATMQEIREAATARFRTSRFCSGRSASWSAAGSISLRSSLTRSGSHRDASSTAKRWYLKLRLWSLPLPWLAIELGWIVAEYGRQPWAIEGVLPTALGVSSVSAGQVLFSLLDLWFFTRLSRSSMSC